MARARNIKPGFFTNDSLGELDPLVRLLFIGLWTICDREGRVEDRPKKIKAELFPYDDCSIDKMLDELTAEGFISRYEAQGKRCIEVVNWHKHQTPHHMEVPSELPPQEGAANRYNHAPVTKQQRERIMRRDKGKCVICGSTKRLHIDHIVAVSVGGSSEDSNLRVLCESCNCSKGNQKSISNRRRVVIDSTSMQRQSDVTSRSTQHQLDNNSKSTQHQSDVIPLIPDTGYQKNNNQEGDTLGVGVDPSPAHVRADVRTHASASERAREGVGHG